jgi:hypothetical protein
LVLPQGSRMSGRVLDSDGKLVTGAYLSVMLLDARTSGPLPERSHATRSDAQGKFEFQGLAPGEYRLHAQPASTQGDGAPLLSTVLERVPTDAAEIEVVMPRGATIRGRLLDAAGSALNGYTIMADFDAHFGPLTTTDADGVFCLPVPRGSSLDLEVRSAPQSENWGTVLLNVPAVLAGTRGLELRLP